MSVFATMKGLLVCVDRLYIGQKPVNINGCFGNLASFPPATTEAKSLSGDFGVKLQHRLLEDPIADGQHVIAAGDIKRRRARHQCGEFLG